jgi:hypothetical protein
MTPFLELRLWWRRAPLANKATSTVAVVAFMALVGWVLIPTGGENTTSGVRAGGTAPGGATANSGAAQGAAADAAAASNGAGATATGGGDGGAAGGPGATGANAGCLPTPDGAPGVTDSTITIGVGYANLAGAIGNSAVGLGSPQDYANMAKVVVDDVNANGGVQCRQLAYKMYEGNPINQDQTQATCLQVGQDAPLAFADAGAFVYPLGQYGCLAQQHIPLVTVAQAVTSDLQRFYPYLSSTSADTATEMKSSVFGAKQIGFFDPANGFQKLGLLEDDCTPEVNQQFEAALASAGITQVSKYQFSCPGGGFASPVEMAQAVVQFQNRDHATAVVPLTGGGSFLSFSEAAQRQGYKPKYLATNYNGFLVTATTPTGPDPDNFDGATAISLGTYGMDTTAGFPVDAGTARCQEILGRAGFPPSEVFAPQGGSVCSSIWTLVAAINHASGLTREDILPALSAAGPVQLAYAYPDASFSAPSKLYGGDTWSVLNYSKGCKCWQIVSGEQRQPSFAP